MFAWMALLSSCLPVERAEGRNPDVLVGRSQDLRVTLSDVPSSLEPPSLEPQEQGGPIEHPERLFEALPALEAADGDRATLQLHPRKPARSGKIVSHVFPPRDSRPLPEATALLGKPRVLRFQPEGEVAQVSPISITFDRPMIAVSSQDAASAVRLATLSPEVAGRWRWLGTRTLLFEPDAPGPMATEFAVTIPGGDGGLLDSELRFAFATPPPALARSQLSMVEPLAAHLLLSFDQRIDPEKILPMLRVDGGSLRRATESEIAADPGLSELWSGAPKDRTFVARVEDLAPHRTYTLTLPEGLPSEEGPRKTTERHSVRFSTYKPLSVIPRCDDSNCYQGSFWYLDFNNPLDTARLSLDKVTVSPPVRGWSAVLEGRTRIRLSGESKPDVHYQVTTPAVTDVYGQRLESEVFHFTPSARPPRRASFRTAPSHVHYPSDPAVLPVWSINVPAFEVTIRSLDAKDYSRGLVGAPGVELFSGVIETRNTLDREVETRIDLSPYLEDGLGHLAVSLFPKGMPDNKQELWLSFTGLGLSAYSDGTRLVGWVNDLATGLPAAGATLEWLGGQAASVGQGGLVELPLPEDPGWLVARRGHDFAVLHSDAYRSSSADELLWYTASDRGVYRPGEVARVKGWLRRRVPGPTGDIEGVAEGEVRWTLQTGGEQPLTGTVPVSPRGGFDLAVAIPSDIALGQIPLLLEAQGDQTYCWLFVQEFRRPEYEVQIHAPQAAVIGEQIEAVIAADYYSGGGLPDAEVKWRVSAHPTWFTPPGWSGWRFGAGSSSYKPATEWTGRTDRHGEHHLAMGFEGKSLSGPHAVSLEGTVMDANHQAWTTKSSLLLHPSDRYVGLRAKRYFFPEGEPIEMSVALVDALGQPMVGPFEVILSSGETQERARCAGETDSAGTAVCRFPAQHPGAYRALASARDAHARLSQASLWLQVTGSSAGFAGEKLLLAEHNELVPGDVARILVSAPFLPAEGVMTVDREGIVKIERFSMTTPTKLIELPIEEAHVPNLLVRVDLVGASRTKGSKGSESARVSETISLGVLPAHRTLDVVVSPSVSTASPRDQVSVSVAVATSDGSPAVGAEVAVFVVDESVLSLTEHRLPDPLDVFYRARSSRLRVSHLRDSLWRAPPPLPDTEDTPNDVDRVLDKEFLQRIPAGRTYQTAVQTVPGVAATAAIRADFSALALFEPALSTGADGRARVTFTLPDSVTRYRIMAVAADERSSFGRGESSITAALPLMVRPSPPRFANTGDQFEIPVIVQNVSDRDLSVSVGLRGTNIRLTDAISEVLPDAPDVALSMAAREVRIAARSRAELRFPVATLMAGTARLQAVARGEDASGAVLFDATAFELPIQTPATTEDFATYGQIDKGAERQIVSVPHDVWPQFGELSITTSSTQMSELTDALLYLMRYPYDNTEAIASRIIAVAALRDVLSVFEAPGLPNADVSVQEDISELIARQRPDGSFSSWHTSSSWPLISIHAANALARAKQKGYDVRPAAWSLSQGYLEQIKIYTDSRAFALPEQRFLRAYAVDVLRRMGAPDPAEALTLYQEAGSHLDLDGLALLLPTLHEGGYTRESSEILKALSQHVSETASAARFATYPRAGRLLYSDRRMDGIILEALLEVAPESDLVVKVARGLLKDRTNGHWGNTHDNAFVLLALDRYFQVYEGETPNFVARVWLGDDYVGEHPFEGRTVERSLHTVPLGLLTEHHKGTALTLAKDGNNGRLYYRIGLNYAPRTLRLDPADHGFTVERRYVAIDDPADVTRDNKGAWHIKAGARVRVEISTAAHDERFHVAVVDPLPAGFEALNVAFANSTSTQGGGLRSPYGWLTHKELRDDRVAVFADELWGVIQHSYIARATTIGRFTVPPTKAEEMYNPETFGRSGSDLVIVE